MSITESFTFWAGRFLWDVVSFICFVVLVFIVVWFMQDDKEKKK